MAAMTTGRRAPHRRTADVVEEERGRVSNAIATHFASSRPMRSIDLFAKIPHGDGQTYLRELLLAQDHLSYHTGQLVLVRQALGAWPREVAQ